MKEAEEQAEPPSWLGLPIFMIGQDCRGNWVVRDQSGARGGLFVNREAALRFVRFENGNRPQAVVMVAGAFELDMTGKPAVPPHRRYAVELQYERRVA